LDRLTLIPQLLRPHVLIEYGRAWREWLKGKKS